MFTILKKTELNPDITTLVVSAPAIAKAAQAGQFAVIIIDEKGERIPLTLADWDAAAGTITFIFQKVGFTTRTLGLLKPGEQIAHILGPLGHPTQVKGYANVVCIGGGVGIAEVYPVSRAFKEAGCRVTGIIGCRNKGLLILEEEMRRICDSLSVTTDDGSYGRKGLVLDVLKELAKPDLVYAIGPVPMMKAVADHTKVAGIKTIVSLNPIMVDATGMCGACRCTVAGKTAFGCVDGPDFDAHQVDFDELKKRLGIYKDQETRMRAPGAV